MRPASQGGGGGGGGEGGGGDMPLDTAWAPKGPTETQPYAVLLSPPEGVWVLGSPPELLRG
eukprot:7767491-Pyramimonas_sp.AAC.1